MHYAHNKHMKVYFGATTSKFPIYKDYYISIRNILVNHGHTITRDWIQNYKKDLIYNPQKIEKEHKPGKIYKQVIKALYQADALVIEDTVSSFSNGHLMTLALQRKIPILVLWLKNHKKTYLKQNFIHGIESEYLQIETYTKRSLEEILNRFFNKYEDYRKKHRFNLVMSEVENKYIKWLSHKKNKSKTEIIRETIRDKIGRDRAYSKYLAK